MSKHPILPILLVCLSIAAAAPADDWSFAIGAGPFTFGKFAEKSQIAGTPGSTTSTIKTSLSAGTRAGGFVDIERGFSERFAIRLEGSFTRAPLTVKTGSGGSGVEVGTGDIAVTSVILPLVFRVNPHGAFRFHIMGGPAFASYDIRRAASAEATNFLFDGSRSRYGIAGGGGIAWWLGPRLAVEGQIVDIVTSSPIERQEFTTATRGVSIPRTQNIQTTVGLRLRF
jgi:hypothetical protein